MKTKKFIVGFFITFIVALVVNIAISIAWSYFKGEEITVKWEASFSLALVLAIVIPLTQWKPAK